MNKREIWELIKQKDKKTSEFILELAEAFGKLDNVEIIRLGHPPRRKKGRKNVR